MGCEFSGMGYQVSGMCPPFGGSGGELSGIGCQVPVRLPADPVLVRPLADFGIKISMIPLLFLQ